METVYNKLWVEAVNTALPPVDLGSFEDSVLIRVSPEQIARVRFAMRLCVLTSLGYTFTGSQGFAHRIV